MWNAIGTNNIIQAGSSRTWAALSPFSPPWRSQSQIRSSAPLTSRLPTYTHNLCPQTKPRPSPRPRIFLATPCSSQRPRARILMKKLGFLSANTSMGRRPLGQRFLGAAARVNSTSTRALLAALSAAPHPSTRNHTFPLSRIRVGGWF